MDKQNPNKTNQATLKNSIPSPFEVKPKFEFGTIQIAAIFGIIVTAVIVYIAKILWYNRQRFIKASEEFRVAFDVAIHALETTPFCDRNILNENFRTHEKAMIKFKEHLRGKKLDCFNKDWKQYEKYCLSRVDVPLLCFIATEVSDINGPNDSAEIDLKHRQKALEHIRNLLTYTKS